MNDSDSHVLCGSGRALRIAMMKGTLWKSTSSYAGGMERRYCVLVGTLMLDFESADEFLNGVPPKAEAEVIGASVWRGECGPYLAPVE